MSKKNGTKQDVNLISLIERYGNEDKCRAYLEELRWPNGVACPRCGSTSISRVLERDQFDCNSCRYQFSVTSGTIFHDSHLPLWKWLATMYLMIESKKGISANQVKRTIGVSYKTAWYLCHRVRNAMTETRPKLLREVVEVDETYVGGKTKGFGHGFKGNKTIVVGATQRGGEARLQVVDDNGRKTLHQFIRENTAPNTEVIYTDDWPAYRGIDDKDTRHETVNHSAEEWVRGDVHTNTVEGVWSLLKRSIVGSYHKISVKHLDSYLDELEWRYNNRENPYLFRDTLRKLIQSENLPYRGLTNG
ncbi:MAG: IS1595 family transposase [Dehalococcoidales bacterium]|nr:IS1595 family transposase [Dehalococcoidales bacterium]